MPTTLENYWYNYIIKQVYKIFPIHFVLKRIKENRWIWPTGILVTAPFVTWFTHNIIKEEKQNTPGEADEKIIRPDKCSIELNVQILPYVYNKKKLLCIHITLGLFLLIMVDENEQKTNITFSHI